MTPLLGIALMSGLFIGLLLGAICEKKYQQDRYEILDEAFDGLRRMHFREDVIRQEEHASELQAMGGEIASLQVHVDCCNAEISQLTDQRNEIHGRYHELLTRSIRVRELLDDVS